MLEPKKKGVVQIINSYRLTDDCEVCGRVMILKRGENVDDRNIKPSNEHVIPSMIVTGKPETRIDSDETLRQMMQRVSVRARVSER